MSDPSSLPQPRAGVLDIAIYVPGKSKVPEGVELHKLSANENPLGTSPHAQKAMTEIAATLHDYPDGQSTILREAIASKYGLNTDNIICGSGSDEILSLIANTFLSEGDEAIYSEHGFLMYPIAIKGASATPIKVDEVDCTANVDNILAAVTPKTKIVFLANPNNPTGTYIPNDEVRRLHEGLPSNVILVLDAAYAEYVRRNDYEAGIELVASSQNVIMTRTFSKIYGLAALRIGWGYGSKHILDAMNRVRGPFNVNSAAIAAATAAINDQLHVDNSVAHNDEWLDKLTRSFEAIGLIVTPSVGNFILVHFPEGSNKNASDADAFLTQNGYVLREMSGYGFPNALRMTIGSAEANQSVIKLLTQFMA